MRQTMTYGVLPSKESFEAAFAEECPTGHYHFGNDPFVGTDKLTCNQLWEMLQKQRNDWENLSSDPNGFSQHPGDKAGEWCSAVLYTLGFEWV